MQSKSDVGSSRAYVIEILDVTEEAKVVAAYPFRSFRSEIHINWRFIGKVEKNG